MDIITIGDACARVESARQQLHEALDERDQIITQAYTSGTPVPELAHAAGITVQAVYKLLRNRRTVQPATPQPPDA